MPKKADDLKVSMAIDQPASLGKRTTLKGRLGRIWEPTKMMAEIIKPEARKYLNLLGPVRVLKARTRLKGRVYIRRLTRVRREPVWLKFLRVR